MDKSDQREPSARLKKKRINNDEKEEENDDSSNEIAENSEPVPREMRSRSSRLENNVVDDESYEEIFIPYPQENFNIKD